jgi:hypothetical protein
MSAERVKKIYFLIFFYFFEGMSAERVKKINKGPPHVQRSGAPPAAPQVSVFVLLY